MEREELKRLIVAAYERLGLEPREQFREKALAASIGYRRTGATTHMLVEAAVRSCLGQRVCLRAHTHNYEEVIVRTARRYAEALGGDPERISGMCVQERGEYIVLTDHFYYQQRV